MKSIDEIFKHSSIKPVSFMGFYREHQIGILGTVAFHMILLIVFLLVKIDKFKEIKDMDLVLEFIEAPIEELPMEETESREVFLEKLIKMQLSLSNQAVNVDKLEEEISTEKYVEDYLKQLEEEKSNENKLKEEELDEFLNKDEIVPLEQKKTEEDKEKPEFTGPTTISYKFLSAPFNRVSVYLPVPVYKCQGYGEVEVLVNVSRTGKVTSASSKIIQASEDPECLQEIAEKYALRSIFRGNANAPSDHKAKINYVFIAQ